MIFRENPLNLHQKGINRLQLTANSLVTGCRDGIVRQWDLDSLSLEFSYNGHTHWVNDIEISDSFLFSASSDSRILVWQLQDPSSEPISSILIHKDYIHSIKLFENSLFSAGEDGTIISTSLDYKSTKLFSSPISIWNIDCTEHLIAAAFSSKVFFKKIGKVLDLRTGKMEIDLKGHTEYIRKISISEREILTCSSDHSVKLWDIGTKKVIETYHMHGTSVFAMRPYWGEGFL